MPKMKLLRGERIRDRVVNHEEEKKYLAVAPEPLASIVTVLFDTGLRADECFQLRWEAISWMNGQHSTLKVTHGKSAAARRVLPMTPRVRMVLENRWLAARKPDTGYVWPGETSTGYIHDEMVRRAHLKVMEAAKIRHFVLHSVRHTFLTRLGDICLRSLDWMPVLVDKPGSEPVDWAIRVSSTPQFKRRGQPCTALHSTFLLTWKDYVNDSER